MRAVIASSAPMSRCTPALGGSSNPSQRPTTSASGGASRLAKPSRSFVATVDGVSLSWMEKRLATTSRKSPSAVLTRLANDRPEKRYATEGSSSTQFRNS